MVSRDALVRVATPGGQVVIPGADGIEEGLKAVRNGDDVNYEGAATTLDWNDDGDVTSGVIGTWQYSGGAIVELDKIPFTLN
jgi:hypothetical protein